MTPGRLYFGAPPYASSKVLIISGSTAIITLVAAFIIMAFYDIDPFSIKGILVMAPCLSMMNISYLLVMYRKWITVTYDYLNVCTSLAWKPPVYAGTYDLQNADTFKGRTVKISDIDSFTAEKYGLRIKMKNGESFFVLSQIVPEFEAAMNKALKKTDEESLISV